MAECAAQCSSIASSSCVSCLGGSYQQCKGCFKREEAVLQSNFEEGEFNGFKKKIILHVWTALPIVIL